MVMGNKFRIILSHMFSKKALKYRAFTAAWTLAMCYVWTHKWVESIEVMLSVVLGKFIFYGIHEYLHMDMEDM